MPMAWGIVRPAVLMPADADEWPGERLRIVLLHELAHVRRRDCLTHVLAQAACAVYWFHPLAWMAARRARAERERACDDLVLAAGTRGSDYAEELLQIARVMRAGRFPAVLAGATLAMAHRSQLEGRLLAILDPRMPRRGMTRVRALATSIACACAVVPLAALQPWASGTADQGSAARRGGSVARAVGAAAGGSPTPGRATPTPRARRPARPRDGASSRRRPAPCGGVAAALAQSDARRARGRRRGRRGVAQRDRQHVVDEPSRRHGAGTCVSEHRRRRRRRRCRCPIRTRTRIRTRRRRGRQATAGAPIPRTIAALTAALKDTDKDVRETAMHALVQMRDPSIFEPLVRSAARRSRPTCASRRRSASASCAIGAPSIRWSLR